jgi:hypothetical protein
MKIALVIFALLGVAAVLFVWMVEHMPAYSGPRPEDDPEG